MTERAMYLSHAGTLFYVPRVRGSAAVAKLGNGARFRVSSRRGSQVRILAAASSVRFGKHFRTPPPGQTKSTGGIPHMRGMRTERRGGGPASGADRGPRWRAYLNLGVRSGRIV